MSCGNSLKTRNMKSCVRYYNNSVVALAAESTVQLQVAGTRVVDTGLSIQTEPMSYNIVKSGLYHLSEDIIVDATTPGDLTIVIYKDGVPLPCTQKEVHAFTGENIYHIETDLMIRGCCDINHTFTYFVISDDAVGNITHICTGIIKEA